MIRSIWKAMPALLLSSAGLYAQNAAPSVQQAPIAALAKPAEAPKACLPCGIVENNNCFARGCANMYGFAIEGDFLWWRAHNPGFVTGFDQKDPSFSGAFGGNSIAGSLLDLKANWNPGFRVGAGWNTSFDRWDLFVSWTWYRDHSSKHRTRSDITTATSVLGYYPLWPFQVLIGTAVTNYKSMQSGWRMQHEAFDLELGRAYYLTQQLSLRPHWGLRGGWINQNFTAGYSLPLMAGSYAAWSFRGKNDCWGIGPRIGLNGEWHIASGFSVLGKASGSLLSGNTKVKYTTLFLGTGQDTMSLDREYNRRVYTMSPNVQIFLGLNWGGCFNNEAYVGLDAGWEINYYWDQFKMPLGINTVTPPNTVSNNAPVVMEGLTVNAHFDF
jgi:hypothetical protein